MTNYQSRQLSRTLGTIVLSGILASQALASTQAEEQKHDTNFYRGYRSGAIAQTFDQYANVITGEYCTAPPLANFEDAVSQFYSQLLSTQELLGADFEAVLQQNLWDLYEA